MKDQLDPDELTFLYRNGLRPDDVYDARGKPTWLWKQRIREEGKTLALATECGNGGHRLRTRAGHCVQCDPKKLSFQKRFSAKAHVYIAGSLAGRLIKIGTCVDCEQRQRQLRAEGYGGYSDWQMLLFITVERAGEVEHLARRKLSAYGVASSYVKDGNYQEATELLRCSYKQASEALIDVSEAYDVKDSGWFGINSQRYNFESSDNEC